MHIKDKYPIREENLAYRVIDGSAIIINTDSLEDSIVHFLNIVGTRIWELCDGKTSVKDIISHILMEYDVGKSVLTKDCIGVINSLQNKKLLSLIDKPVSR